MGNCLSKWFGNWFGGDSADDIQQPFLFGKFPEPYSIDKIQPELLFFSKSNESIVSVDWSQSAEEAVSFLKSKGFLQCNRLVVITHGFQTKKTAGWLHQLKDSILAVDPSQQSQQEVAILGWGNGADIGLLNYAQAAANSIKTGQWLGKFLVALRADQSLKSLQTYGIGHSLGAHLIGVAGRSSHGSFDRITGLDPAGVGFQDQNIEKRLQPTDAELVDVIHTDGQDVPYFGTLIPLGSIDFYPNYGWNQPTDDRDIDEKPRFNRNSRGNSKKKRAKPSPYGGNISESHGRALAYFIWSVQNRSLFRTAMQCDGKPDLEKPVHRIATIPEGGGVEVEMGYWCDQHLLKKCTLEDEKELENESVQSQIHRKVEQLKGCYYVHTNASAPWC